MKTAKVTKLWIKSLPMSVVQRFSCCHPPNSNSTAIILGLNNNFSSAGQIEKSLPALWGLILEQLTQTNLFSEALNLRLRADGGAIRNFPAKLLCGTGEFASFSHIFIALLQTIYKTGFPICCVYWDHNPAGSPRYQYKKPL